jgi:hypothetical protein
MTFTASMVENVPGIEEGQPAASEDVNVSGADRALLLTTYPTMPLRLICDEADDAALAAIVFSDFIRI